MPELDHVVWAVPSIHQAAGMLLAQHGLVTRDGGVHPAWGTRNAIVPLGSCYLELVQVDDPLAPDVGFTERVRHVASLGGGPAMWCERVVDIDAEAAARGYQVVPGRRVNPDGSVLSWRVAGMAQACAQPAVPFIITWDDPSAMPGGMPAAHACGPITGVAVQVDGDGPRSITIHGDAGAITLP